MGKPLLEAFKEMMRVVVIAVIPILIDSLTRNAVDYRLIGVTAVIAALRFIDSWLHQTGVAEKGLTRF